MTDHGYIGTVLVPGNSWEARALARVRFPLRSIADGWAGYRWVADPSVPPDCFILVGVDRDGVPVRQVVPLEPKEAR